MQKKEQQLDIGLERTNSSFRPSNEWCKKRKQPPTINFVNSIICRRWTLYFSHASKRDRCCFWTCRHCKCLLQSSRFTCSFCCFLLLACCFTILFGGRDIGLERINSYVDLELRIDLASDKFLCIVLHLLKATSIRRMQKEKQQLDIELERINSPSTL